MTAFTMSRTAADILTAIDKFAPTKGNWLELEDLLEELFRNESPSLGIDSMLRIFERHPVGEDGAGVFWSIVHGLEALPDYENRLVESVRRAPSEFGLLMRYRLLNSGISEAGGIPLISLLEHVARSRQTSHELRTQAASFVARGKRNSH